MVLLLQTYHHLAKLSILWLDRAVTENQTKKIFVGMSGGVDSSVSAALLKEQGFSVTGVFIRVWQPEGYPCTWREERRDAMRVCAQLDIPFLTLDLSDEYKEAVVDYLVSEYEAGRTPNPDVMCNREIKFKAFLNKALEMGADMIATGHYARVQKSDATGRFELLAGVDKGKDQSYFLWTLGQHELSHTLFPVGHLEKSEVRKLAEKFGLPVAEKKDSQGICFLGKIDIKDFLLDYFPSEPGEVVDEKGEAIGTHRGARFYTLGERHGFDILQTTAHSTPMYIVGRDLEKNRLIVSPKKSEEEKKQGIALHEVNIIGGELPSDQSALQARVRYRQPLSLCQAEVSKDGIEVRFQSTPDSPPTAGQSLVFYEGEICLGGGIIV